MIVRIFLTAVTISVLGLTDAQAQTPADNIAAILELSGLNKQIDQIPALIAAGLAEQHQGGSDKMSPEEYDRLSRIMADAYKAAGLRQSIGDYFQAHYDQDRATAVITVLRSPLNKKMTGLETAASTPEAYQAIQKYAEDLKSDPPTPGRMELVRSLDRVTGSTETNVAIQVSTTMAVVIAMNAAAPPDKRLDRDQLQQLRSRMSAQLRSPTERLTLASFLYTYRSVSDPELAAYITLSRSDEGQWLTHLTQLALINTMSEAAEKMGKEMAKSARLPKRSI